VEWFFIPRKVQWWEGVVKCGVCMWSEKWRKKKDKTVEKNAERERLLMKESKKSEI